ncbi:MAG: MYXO-CTERM sorting domain-containing protein, partial [Myxococcota bacterium]
RVRFEGAVEGTDGSAADWRVTVVQDLPGGPLYTPVALDGATGEVLLEDVEDAPIHLVVAAVPERARTDETFAWSYAVTWEAPDGGDTGAPEGPARPDVDGDDEMAGCGCASGGSAWMAGALVAAGLVARRRR